MTRIGWLNGLIGGLLVSSCCLVQLLLNVFGIGCAGLNTLLLPYRSIFISLTIISLTYSFLRYHTSKWHIGAIIIFTLMLSLSPEILRAYNNQFSNNDNLDKQTIITHWQITGMHCEGCRSAVIRALKNLDGVLSVNVVLETGQAKLITLHNIDTNTVIQAVKAAGFQAARID